MSVGGLLSGVTDGTGEGERYADAEDEDDGIEGTEENGIVGLPEGEVPGEGAVAVLTVDECSEHDNSLLGLGTGGFRRIQRKA